MDTIGRKIGRIPMLVAGLMLAAGGAGTARADFYAYSEQQISNIVFTGATQGTATTNTQDSVSQIGVPNGSEAHNNPIDALQSYAGPSGTRPAENTFTPLGQVNADYVHSDVALQTGPVLTTVAEGYKNNAGSSTAASSYSISAPITLTASGTVTLSLTFANMLKIIQGAVPGGSETAGYSFDFNIQNANGVTVFDFAPGELNQSISQGTSGTSGSPNSGTMSVTSGTLAAGTYTATIVAGSTVFLSSVPEPSSIVLMGVGGIGSLLLARSRRAAKR